MYVYVVNSLQFLIFFISWMVLGFFLQYLFLGAGTCVHVILTTGQDVHGETPTVRDMREKGAEGGGCIGPWGESAEASKCLSHLLVIGIGIVQYRSIVHGVEHVRTYHPLPSLQKNAAVSRLSVQCTAMAPIPPYVARVTETQRGVELHTTHGHELLTVSSRTKKARDFPWFPTPWDAMRHGDCMGLLGLGVGTSPQNWWFMVNYLLYK